MQIIDVTSPNSGPRKGCSRPDMVVLHYTAMAGAEDAVARLRDPAAEVSAHYVIAEDGRIWRLVAEEDRAWHAGISAWGDVSDVNSRSIGIELANAASLRGFPPFPEPQMTALEALLDGILQRWDIPAERVVGHSDVAPGRKFDPGPKFDWKRLALRGLATWPEPDVTTDTDWELFGGYAARAGYVAPDGNWRAVLRSVRLRFRPWATGDEPDCYDVATVKAMTPAYSPVNATEIPQ